MEIRMAGRLRFRLIQGGGSRLEVRALKWRLVVARGALVVALEA